ncbi:hypothetical protein NDR87_30840 [Nocardia sp. CDC159]|uniref:Uncharacterized protein n=1 Tax=Nocardia pulmonis TaxID=2951408 RepID=A0A9X2EFN3_9NOCA|nr:MULTISPECIES: hypothetical protein [Nocardia]MCM6778053.1 hypothetical protein [Nocardia pulmonis]MCM6790776.1 hypothetical protein [Nocardia sp. CDC159]
MSNRQCAACSRETDMFLCWHCCRTLRDRLETAAWLATELDVTLARQDRMGGPGNMARRGAEMPLPLHLAASEAGWVLRNTVTAWARDVCETRDIEYPDAAGTADVARWLARNAVSIALSEGAGQAFEEIDAAVKSAQRVIDRPPGRLYVGPCGAESDGAQCHADIYVRMGSEEARCPVCGTAHSVEQRREELRAQVRELLGTAAELARLLPWIMGAPITRKRITYYANKGMISRREHRGETVFQIGEVIDAHIQCEGRRAA